MTDAPLTVTNQVATRPDGDGEGATSRRTEHLAGDLQSRHEHLPRCRRRLTVAAKERS